MFESAAESFYRALMWAGHLVCHQMPARSPHLFGVQLPLCWRCTGIAVGALAFLAWLSRARRLPALRPCLAFSLLVPLDVLYNVVTRGDGDNARRLVTGLLFGFFAAALSLRFFTRLAALRRQPDAATRDAATRDGGVTRAAATRDAAALAAGTPTR